MTYRSLLTVEEKSRAVEFEAGHYKALPAVLEDGRDKGRKPRRPGLGPRLFEGCVRFGRGYETLTLWTDSALDGARCNYEKRGIKLVEKNWGLSRPGVGEEPHLGGRRNVKTLLLYRKPSTARIQPDHQRR